MIATRRLRAGLYETAVTCRLTVYTAEGRRECGGKILVERDGTALRDFRWEAYCRSCLECDPNGHATLRQAAEAAPDYFGAGCDVIE